MDSSPVVNQHTPPPPTVTLRSPQRALGVIFFIMLMDIIGLTILYPVVPYIVQRFSSGALMVTLMTVIYAGAQFFAAPALGRLSDRYGRRPILLGSIFGSVIGYVAFGIGQALWVLFLSRLIDGVTGGNLSTASAYIADVSEPQARARNFGLMGLAWGLGLVLGPALGGTMSRISLEAPVFMAAILSAVGVFLAYFELPESLPEEYRETSPIRLNDLNPFASIGEMARKPGLGRLLFVLCLFNFAFNGINSTQSLFLIWKFEAQPWQIGLLLVLIGVVIALIQGLVSPAVS